MGLAEFLVANQSWVAPVIEWGGLILFLAIVLSPFLIIRHSFFKPIRWWHIVGAYVSSIFVYVVIWYFIGKVDQLLIRNYFNTIELSSAYGSVLSRSFTWLLILYPLVAFYASKLLHGKFTKKQFLITGVIAVIFAVVLWATALYSIVMLAGWALSESI